MREEGKRGKKRATREGLEVFVIVLESRVDLHALKWMPGICLSKSENFKGVSTGGGREHLTRGQAVSGLLLNIEATSHGRGRAKKRTGGKKRGRNL